MLDIDPKIVEHDFVRQELGPHKCMFCIILGQLVGFIVSKYKIIIDHFKVEVILKLPPPHTIRENTFPR